MLQLLPPHFHRVFLPIVISGLAICLIEIAVSAVISLVIRLCLITIGHLNYSSSFSRFINDSIFGSNWQISSHFLEDLLVIAQNVRGVLIIFTSLIYPIFLCIHYIVLRTPLLKHFLSPPLIII